MAQRLKDLDEEQTQLGAQRELRRKIADARLQLTRVERELSVPHEARGRAVRDAVERFGEEPSRPEAVARVAALVEPVAREVERVRAQHELDIRAFLKARAEPPLDGLLKGFDAFDAYDAALFPLTFGTDLGETNPVAVVRISPQDASGPCPEGRPELNGRKVHHYGAFLDREWRRHDILWGRLDGAECLINELLRDSGHEAEAAQLIGRAHESIVTAFAGGDLGGSTPGEWLAASRPPAHPDDVATTAALSRARRVLALILATQLRSPKEHRQQSAQRTREPDDHGRPPYLTRVTLTLADAILADGNPDAVLDEATGGVRWRVAELLLCAFGIAACVLLFTRTWPVAAGILLTIALLGITALTAAPWGMRVGIADLREKVTSFSRKAVELPDSPPSEDT